MSRESPQTLVLGGGTRVLPRLLAVTDTSELAARIGLLECQLAVQTLHDGACGVITNARTLHAEGRLVSEVRNEARRLSADGVLLVGGYNVVPSISLDTLPVQVSTRPPDADDWWVWTDDPYGEVEPGGGQLLPVSRIPDGHSAGFLLYALQAEYRAPSAWQGLRNRHRPFVEHITPEINFGVSSPFTVDAWSESTLGTGRNYVMLHGLADDGTRMFGENKDHTYAEALTVDRLETSNLVNAVVFAAACWGALIVDQSARSAPADRDQISSRTPRQSIALQVLDRGASAFVGCTGAHWSPADDGVGFSAPLHQAFWDALRGGQPPAVALRDAKAALAGYLQDVTEQSELAIVAKSLRQFTCLGLGW